MVEPAREYDKQSGPWPNPKRLAVRIAWSSHGVHARARVKELQNPAEGPIRAVGSGIHIIHA
jgi:hypothetical protein